MQEPASPRDRTAAPDGVLPIQQLRRLDAQGHITALRPIDDRQFQPASLDLRLGRRAHRVQASFLTGTGATVEDKLAGLSMGRFDLNTPTILERNCVYLVELQERMFLPPDIGGKANPKSTTGRLDVFTRVVTDRSTVFDHIATGYQGPLYAEIVPRTFVIMVRQGDCLSQLRLERGEPLCSDAELRAANHEDRLTRTRGHAPGHPTIDDGLHVSARIAGDGRDGVIAYRGRGNAPVVDLNRRRHYRPADFWEPITAPASGRLILNPGDFYLLGSEERLRVPDAFAAEMVPFDPAVGEFRIHYAGFFDPGFGCSDQRPGTPAVLEVRAHETALSMEHGQRIGRLLYSRMAETPDHCYGSGIGSAYNSHELALSKQFAETQAR